MAGASIRIDSDALLAAKVPVLEVLGGSVDAKLVGWGSDSKQNLELRKAVLGAEPRPNAWAGLGIFDPPEGWSKAVSTKEDVRRIKLGELAKMCEGDSSAFTFLGHQPLVSMSKDHIKSTEVLLRARNGSNCAPYEDVTALANATTAEETEAYSKLMAFQGVDEILSTVAHPSLRNLSYVSINYRKKDLRAQSGAFAAVRTRIKQLSVEDKTLLTQKKVIEIVEDEPVTKDFLNDIDAWYSMGFSRSNFSIDDMVGDKASTVLAGTAGPNHHTISACAPLRSRVGYMKVDMHWAKLIFLSFPGWSEGASEDALKAAKEDRVSISGVPKTSILRSELLDEFVHFCIKAMADGIKIVIELTLDGDHAGNAWALEQLLARNLDVMGRDAAFFSMQGGKTGAKAFPAALLAANVKDVGHTAGAAAVQTTPPLGCRSVPGSPPCSARAAPRRLGNWVKSSPS